MILLIVYITEKRRNCEILIIRRKIYFHISINFHCTQRNFSEWHGISSLVWEDLHVNGKAIDGSVYHPTNGSSKLAAAALAYMAFHHIRARIDESHCWKFRVYSWLWCSQGISTKSSTDIQEEGVEERERGGRNVSHLSLIIIPALREAYKWFHFLGYPMHLLLFSHYKRAW